MRAGMSDLRDAIGKELGPTDWLEISQERIDAFADATDDHQWIHVDPARAADGPFGTTIAHGYLTLSLCAPLLAQALAGIGGASMGINYGTNKVRFPAPVPVGSRILKVLSDLAELESSRVPKFKALEQMQTRAGCYDPRVLDAAFACFDIYLAAPTEAKASTQALRLNELAIGHVLLSDIKTKEGVLLVPAGSKITALVLEKLRNFAQLSGIKEPIQVQA